VALAHKEADEIRIAIFFFKSFGVKNTNELVVTSNKLTNTSVGLVTSGLEPDVARGPPVTPRFCKLSNAVHFVPYQQIYI
jgi:hypothetical protein